MRGRVFIDTGFWIDLFDKKDRYHNFAKKGIKRILRNYRPYLTDFVVFETLTYLNCAVKDHALAIKFLERVEMKDYFTIMEVDAQVKNRALEIFRKFGDQSFSFVDCTSFAIMQQARLIHYAGFDDHFQHMGFKTIIA